MVSFNANGYIGFRSESFWVMSLEPGFIQSFSCFPLPPHNLSEKE